MASVWMEKKPVSLLSTLAQAAATHTALRKQKDGTRAPVQCTDAVVVLQTLSRSLSRLPPPPLSLASALFPSLSR